ncbi:hypothetical protein DESUT3_29770 [Desulfuromonas versatilis]|uniref:Uncharacterized protein n=1 Tax=Desulfuromonas versatilis TaxID=2802975 RepID=A0ABM8HV87_9BACT|nr:hypothetical protein [Desulfuromonas versatilis]BCR05908.1 hypothetical protein DESUT3_29770 [Desulfuromonas versatilis]
MFSAALGSLGLSPVDPTDPPGGGRSPNLLRLAEGKKAEEYLRTLRHADGPKGQTQKHQPSGNDGIESSSHAQGTHPEISRRLLYRLFTAVQGKFS